VYVPAEFVTVFITCAVALLVMMTLASLTTAPVGSVTIPLMFPDETVVWACAGGAVIVQIEIAIADNRTPEIQE